MKKTKIQWCHSTVNPVMGCAGCELWPGRAQIVGAIKEVLPVDNTAPSTIISAAVQAAVNGRPMSGVYSNRKAIADQIQITLGLSGDNRQALLDAIRSKAKCYAGLLGTMRAGHAGYADTFELPKPYPGRTAMAAGWGTPTADEIADKPWLTGLPRLIFVSDMGDALSKGVSFDYLLTEVIDPGALRGGRPPCMALVEQTPGSHGRVRPLAEATRRPVAVEPGCDDDHHGAKQGFALGRFASGSKRGEGLVHRASV